MENEFQFETTLPTKSNLDLMLQRVITMEKDLVAMNPGIIFEEIRLDLKSIVPYPKNKTDVLGNTPPAMLVQRLDVYAAIRDHIKPKYQLDLKKAIDKAYPESEWMGPIPKLGCFGILYNGNRSHFNEPTLLEQTVNIQAGPTVPLLSPPKKAGR